MRLASGKIEERGFAFDGSTEYEAYFDARDNDMIFTNHQFELLASSVSGGDAGDSWSLRAYAIEDDGITEIYSLRLSKYSLYTGNPGDNIPNILDDATPGNAYVLAIIAVNNYESRILFNKIKIRLYRISGTGTYDAGLLTIRYLPTI